MTSYIQHTIQSLLAFLLIFVSACQTLPSSSHTTDPMQLSKEDEQSLYLKMLQAELKAGVVIVKDQLHTASGVVECRQKDKVRRCSLKTKINDSKFSEEMEIEQDLAVKSRYWIEDVRPDLKNSPIVSASVKCDFIGKKSPPFSVEDVTCRIENPLPPEEVVVGDKRAKALIKALSTDLEKKSGTNTLTGSIQCKVIKSSNRQHCIILLENRQNATIKPERLGDELSREIYKTLSDIRPAANKLLEGAPLRAAVTCFIYDSCRLKILTPEAF